MYRYLSFFLQSAACGVCSVQADRAEGWDASDDVHDGQGSGEGPW